MRYHYLFFISIAVALVSHAAVAQDCKPENTYLTKDGYFAAVNPDALTQMENEKNDTVRNALLKEKTVIKLPAGVTACEVAANFFAYRKRVSLHGYPVPYWVSDTALTPVR